MGGTSIEDVAVAQPEKIFKEPIDIMEGMRTHVRQRLFHWASPMSWAIPCMLTSRALCGICASGITDEAATRVVTNIGFEPGTAVHQVKEHWEQSG